MEKKIEVAGIHLDNLTFRESIVRAENYFNDEVNNAIQMISVQCLNKCEESQELKEYLENVDLSVISDVGFYQIAGIDSKSRRKETEEQYFVKTFLRSIAEKRISVIVLVSGEEDEKKFSQFLFDEKIDLNEVSFFHIGSFGEDFNFENIINDINASNLSVVISLMDIEFNAKLINGYKNQMMVELFWAMGDCLEDVNGSHGLLSSVKKAFYHKIFDMKAHKYNEKEEKQ